jgi:hypothetical protein
MGSRNIFVGLRGDDFLQKKKTNGKGLCFEFKVWPKFERG